MSLFVFFQLIRWKNLLIIFLTQSLIKFVLIPKFETASTFSNLEFLLVTISTLLISASGYIINDIFDIKTDSINKKNQVIVGSSISITFAKLCYYCLNISGLLVGVIASLKIDKPIFSLLFITITLLLYVYSKILKSVPILGNILVAFLVSLSILIITIFEQYPIDSIIFKIIFTYSFFAFGINLIREIIKDIEDIDGDYVENIKTLPIIIGRKRTNLVIVILSILFTISLFTLVILNKELSNSILYYSFIAVILPLLYFISKLTAAKSKLDYKKLSSLLKIIMVLGILSIFTL